MENKYKTGYALKDKDIKFIKNYCKTLEIKTNGCERYNRIPWSIKIKQNS